ncbi:MAG: hypothetical protein JW832_05280 [Deltaproteobacteria bacterium]|nr:hypothetical protein [Deltaproteobacteria bacterium]
MKKSPVIVCLLLFLVAPLTTCSATMQDPVQIRRQRLLARAAAGSALFESPQDLERALLSQPQGGRADRMKKKIAAVRMLVAEGQLQSANEVSSSVLTLSVKRLVAAGEQWVLIAQAGQQTEQSQSEARETECSKEDNRFDIGDCDEFNLFDIIAFPFRIIGWVLELIFNIILFPFKLIFKILL